MSVEEFVVNTEKTIRKFNLISLLMDIVSVTLFLDSLFIIFNMNTLFSSMNTFEVYAGSKYSILGLQVGFESIVLFLASLIISLPIAAIIHIRDRKINTVRVIEEKNSLLKERLSTAYDNRHVSNIIVNDLSRNVAEIVIKLQPTNFLNMARIYQGVACLLIISSSFTYVTVAGVHSNIDPSQLVDNIGNKDPGSGTDLAVMEETTDDSGNESTENLLGEPTVVVVEGKQVDLTLPPGTGTGFTQGEQANSTPEGFTPSSAYDISVISSSIYSEELPEGYESIIKQYFEEMAGK